MLGRIVSYAVTGVDLSVPGIIPRQCQTDAGARGRLDAG